MSSAAHTGRKPPMTYADLTEMYAVVHADETAHMYEVID